MLNFQVQFTSPSSPFGPRTRPFFRPAAQIRPESTGPVKPSTAQLHMSPTGRMALFLFPCMCSMQTTTPLASGLRFLPTNRPVNSPRPLFTSLPMHVAQPNSTSPCLPKLFWLFDSPQTTQTRLPFLVSAAWFWKDGKG